jgi:general stress protein 26
MTLITDDHVKSATRILNTSLYAVIATVNEDGTPWNSPVFFCRDDQFALYWASTLASRHSQNILRNNKVHIVIFDPNASWGQGKGVYLNTNVSILDNRDEIEAVRKLRLQKVAAADQPSSDFFDPSPRRLFKAIPTEVWINMDTEVSGVTIDIRLQIPLESLIRS